MRERAQHVVCFLILLHHGRRDNAFLLFRTITIVIIGSKVIYLTRNKAVVVTVGTAREPYNLFRALFSILSNIAIIPDDCVPFILISWPPRMNR